MGKTVGVVLSLKDKCSPGIKKIAEEMGLTIQKAKQLDGAVKQLSKQMGDGIKKASVVMGAGLGAVALATQQLVTKTVEAGDRIDKMSAKLGLSREGFQQWDYILKQNGADIESMKGGMKALVNNIDGVSKGNKNAIANFKKLGISVKDSSGQLKNQEQVFEEVVAALQKMPDGVNKAKLANDLLGKSGAELMPLLNQSAQSVEELKKRYEDLGMGMSSESVDACVKFGDTMDDIKKSLMGFGAEIGVQFIPILQEMADTFISNLPKIKAAVTPVLNGLINVFKFLTEHIDAVIFVVTSLTSAFALFNVISKAIAIFTLLSQAIQLAGGAMTFFNVVMRANPLGIIVTVIGLVIGAIVLLIKNWDKVKAAVVGFAEKAKSVILDLWNKIKPIFENIAKFAKFAFNFTPIGIAVNTVKTVTEKVNKNKVPHNALGSTNFEGGQTLVGEYGPELVNLPNGARITPASQTQQILSNGNKIDVKIDIHGNIYGEDDFMQKVINRFTLEFNKVLV